MPQFFHPCTLQMKEGIVQYRHNTALFFAQRWPSLALPFFKVPWQSNEFILLLLKSSQILPCLWCPLRQNLLDGGRVPLGMYVKVTFWVNWQLTVLASSFFQLLGTHSICCLFTWQPSAALYRLLRLRGGLFYYYYYCFYFGQCPSCLAMSVGSLKRNSKA